MFTNFDKKLRPRPYPKYTNDYIETGGDNYSNKYSGDTFTFSGFNQSFFISNKSLLESRCFPSS